MKHLKPKNYVGLFFAIIFALPSIFVVSLSEKTPLDVLGLFPYGGDWVDIYSKPSAEMAFRMINAHPTILRDFELRIHGRDTQVGSREVIN